VSEPSFLNSPNLRLLLFGGKGGVGKTTCAVATALWRVRMFPDQPLRLLSTDPAHSLKDSLADTLVPPSIEVIEFDARASLEAFRHEYGPQLQAIAERGTFLDSEDISRFLSLSLPGLDELFAFLDIAKQAESSDATGCTIVDTAPTGHTLRLLSMSELLRRWVGVLDTLLAKHRYMKQLFGRRYVGDELDRFIQELSASIDAADSLLTDLDRCLFVPVMVAEELSVRETSRLLETLDRLRISAGDIVVNRMVPASRCPVCLGTRTEQLRELRQLPQVFKERALWAAPEHPDEVRGSEVEHFVDDLMLFDPKTSMEHARVEIPMPQQPVQDPAPQPPTSMKLLLVGGKGGVGKTTIACATAVRLASSERRVLLFSTDPAHSVGDCLDRSVGPEPTSISPGLMAMEIDAATELDTLKRQYRDELDDFFGSVFKGLDVPFDREVMERIIELSPPGLDEIMALSRAMDFLAERTCDLLILDTAPTGHLLRLLELPEVISQWLKAFFEVFLKYRDVFGVPEFSDRLVRLSKDLHRFRSLLRASGESALYVVSVPTWMSLEETHDLLSACEKMSVAVPVLFLNQMTPTSDCPFCTARARHEEEIAAKFRQSYFGHQTQVFRQPEPRGLDRLEALGTQLFQDREGREASRGPSPT
jgi:arsenite-transporting ATPase